MTKTADFGERVRQRRTALGLTQEELAVKMGYRSKSTINKIEKGINDVAQSTAAKLAECLHTTPAYLLGWTDNASYRTASDIGDDTKELVLKYKNADENIKKIVNDLLDLTDK